jgi:nitrite reductase/ring-hydroxylating ferredoxin subunit
MAFVRVATLQEVPQGKSKQATVNKRKLALFNVAGTIYAIDDTCPHRGAPLWEGTVENLEVICPLHGASFDLCTGANLAPPAPAGVKTYKVQIVGDDIQVDLP